MTLILKNVYKAIVYFVYPSFLKPWCYQQYAKINHNFDPKIIWSKELCDGKFQFRNLKKFQEFKTKLTFITIAENINMILSYFVIMIY